MNRKNNIKFNAEGYYDPTAFGALKNVIKEEHKKIYRPLVFICSPFAGDCETNTANAREYCRFAVNQNAIPIAPHLLYPQFMDENNPDERKLGLFFSRILLDKCSELWVFGTDISHGMKLEIGRAMDKKIRIKYFEDNEVTL